MREFRKTEVNLVPDTVNPTPDYYCTWQTQLYASCDGKPEGQRRIICEKSMFDREKPYGWAYFYEKARGDLFFVMDDSWDVPMEDDKKYYGSLVLSPDKFPEATKDAGSSAESLQRLCDRMKALGWKGLGGWVCAQEAPGFFDGGSREEYWKKRLEDARAAGFSYWKVDWGKDGNTFEFRKMLTELKDRYAPELVVEHASLPDLIPISDVFRSYDVPAVMSIPITMEKLKSLVKVGDVQEGHAGLINCEDEAYLAAAGGFAMGIMRHPYRGAFVDGRADMSFPAVHRNLKTKMTEVVRAVRWHRIAPAFGVNASQTIVDENYLYDGWRFVNYEEEIEAWWLTSNYITRNLKENVLTLGAPARIARSLPLPEVTPDAEGFVPFVVAAKNPNGAVSIVTAGRSREREYFLPECDISLESGDARTVGIFGKYKTFTLKTTLDSLSQVLMQDLAGDFAVDVTEKISWDGKNLTIPGELISEIGTMAQEEKDTSEPGVVVRIL